MEMGSFSSAEKSIWVCSVMEALVAETLVLGGKSLACLLMLTGSVMNYTDASLNLNAVDERFPSDELLKMKHPGLENKDASDTEDDDEDEEEDNADDPDDDDAGDEDFSAEEGDEADPEDEPEANGDGASDDEDDDDDDDDDGDEEDGDEDGEDEEDEDEEDDDDEVPQPPSKKRK